MNDMKMLRVLRRADLIEELKGGDTAHVRAADELQNLQGQLTAWFDENAESLAVPQVYSFNRAMGWIGEDH